MTTTEPSQTSDASIGRDIFHAFRYYFRGWRGPAVLATVVAVAGFALGWSWLVAAGVAPLLLSVLPCVAMCALGLCISRMTGKQCSADTVSDKPLDRLGPTGEDGHTAEVSLARLYTICEYGGCDQSHSPQGMTAVHWRRAEESRCIRIEPSWNRA